MADSSSATTVMQARSIGLEFDQGEEAGSETTVGSGTKATRGCCGRPRRVYQRNRLSGSETPLRFHVAQVPAELAPGSKTLTTRPSNLRELALWPGKKYEGNRPGVDRLGGVLFAACIAYRTSAASPRQDRHTGRVCDGKDVDDA